MSTRVSLLRITAFSVGACVGIGAEAAPWVTRQNSSLSVPSASIAAAGFPGATNLAGTNFILSSVASTTAQGGRASVATAQQWTRRYNRVPASTDNTPLNLVVRSDGSVVVTGYSLGAGTDYDFATICYAANGTPLWTNRFDGPAHGSDFARFLAANASGEVWVAGESRRQPLFIPSDMVLIKYGSDGTPAWTNRFASFETNSSYPWGLVVDDSGNAYVEESATYWSSSIGTPIGVAITKFDTSGNAVWTQRYAENGPDSGEGLFSPGPMALDPAGNLLVAGSSGRPHYYTGKSVVKFAGDGTAIWTNHQPSFFSLFNTLTLDRAGNAILTGDRWKGNVTVYAITKCSAQGVLLWTNELEGPIYQGGNVPKAVPDPEGNVFVVGGHPGGSLGLYQINKLGPDGLALWTRLFVQFGSTNGYFGDAAADNDGNLYLLGGSPAPGRSDFDFVTLKYSAAGTPVWTNRFSGAAGLDDTAFAFGVDGSGNLHVTGRSEASVGVSDFATVKYSDALVYTPPPGFEGLDSVTCILTDRLGHRATGNVEVLVLPGAFRFDVTGTQWTPAGMHLRVECVPGANPVVLEASSDFASWQRILTNSPLGNAVEFLDPAALNLPRRFYRASQEP